MVHLRLASHADIPEILKIVQAVLPLMKEAGNPQWDETYPLQSNFEEDLAINQLWVAVTNSEDTKDSEVVIGMGALSESPEPDYAQAGCDLNFKAIVPHRIAINPLYQRQGIASLFLQQAEQLARERGIPYVRIDTNKLNPAMPTLIAKSGYTFMGEIGLSGKPKHYRYLCYEKAV